MKNFKLLYFLTLCGLFLYVATGPASAGGVIMNTEGAGILNNTTGSLSWPLQPTWNTDSGTTLRLGMEAECGDGASCSGTVWFNFYVFAPANITMSLFGTSSDPHAVGTVAFYDGGQTIQDWAVSDGHLNMPPFTVLVPVPGAYQGEFTFVMAANSELEVPLPDTLDFVAEEASSVPEPGSALLLGAGIAFVGFLRRKVHG